MEAQHYFNIYNYLVNKEFPNNFSSQQKCQLEKQAIYYKIQNNFLYKPDRTNSKKLLRVIKEKELSALLYMMHNDPTAEHLQLMLWRIKSKLDTIGLNIMRILEIMLPPVTLARKEDATKRTMYYTLFQYIVHFTK